MKNWKHPAAKTRRIKQRVLPTMINQEDADQQSDVPNAYRLNMSQPYLTASSATIHQECTKIA
eukprot:190695-Amphidinium_carterae.1